MFKIEWTRKAFKQLHKVGTQLNKTAIFKAVDALKNWPDCKNVKSLSNRSDYRLRIGRYRVIFTVKEIVHIIKIEEVKKRDEHTY